MATEKSSTVTPAVSNIAPLNKRIPPFRNDTVFWKLKDMFHFSDALLRLSSHQDTTEEHLLVLLHGHLEDLMTHYEALTEQDEQDFEKDADQCGLSVVAAELSQKMVVEA